MQCNRLINLIKSWYRNVQNETMAPARMISFIEDHARQCPDCMADPKLTDEITKITELVLPESKIPKAVRMQQEEDEPVEDEEEETSTDEDEDESVDDEDENEDEDEDEFDDDLDDDEV